MHDATKSEKPKPKRRRFLILAVLLLIMAAFGWFLPTIIANTSLRDQVLNSIASAPQYKISSQAASFGWFTPLVIDDLEIKNSDNTSKIKIQRLAAKKSWFELWLSSPNLGSFTIDRPQINVVARDADADENEIASTSDLMPTLSASIKNAHVVVTSKKDAEPELNVDNIDLEVQLDRADTTSFLGIGRVLLLDRAELTPELCASGLQLIAPVIADELNIRGTVTVELTKTRLPLNASEDQFRKMIELEGVLTLKKVTAGIKNPITLRLANMFAELLELDEVPDDWQIASEAKIEFHVLDGRFVHESMTMILPDIAPDFAIGTSGSVTLDEKIDLVVTVQFPQILLGGGPLAQKLSQTLIEIRISGTIDQPKIGLPADPQWVIGLSDDLLSQPLAPDDQRLADDAIQFIADLYGESDPPPANLPAPLLQRIQNL